MHRDFGRQIDRIVTQIIEGLSTPGNKHADVFSKSSYQCDLISPLIFVLLKE